MGFYLGNDGRRISRLSTEPVYAGEKRIVRVYAGSRMIYPDKDGYSYAHMFLFPVNTEYIDGPVVCDCLGTRMDFNEGAQIDDAVIYGENLGGGEEEAPDYIFSMAAKGRNITSARVRGFLGYQGNIICDSSEDNELFEEAMTKKDLGSGVTFCYMEYMVIEPWPYTFGNPGTTLVDAFTPDVRILHSEDEYYAYIGEE